MKAEKTGDREITFTFDSPGNRELPQIIGQLTVLPKHWWESTDKNGSKRDVAATTLEPPLGTGPIGSRNSLRAAPSSRARQGLLGQGPQRQRRPATISTRLRFEYFRDSTVALEAFKADQVDWRTENSAKDWATSYDFPAIREKRVVKEEFPDRNPGIMQAFVFNIRRDKSRTRGCAAPSTSLSISRR